MSWTSIERKCIAIAWLLFILYKTLGTARLSNKGIYLMIDVGAVVCFVIILLIHNRFYRYDQFSFSFNSLQKQLKTYVVYHILLIYRHCLLTFCGLRGHIDCSVFVYRLTTSPFWSKLSLTFTTQYIAINICPGIHGYNNKTKKQTNWE